MMMLALNAGPCSLQICSWLKDSAEMFLQSRIELGTSLETAEDLLMEHQEFEIRAKVRSRDYHITVIIYNIM